MRRVISRVSLPSNVRCIFRKALSKASKSSSGSTNFPSRWRSRAGQTAQDRRHGLRAGPISRDDKLKNESSTLAFHLAYERQLTTENDNLSYLLRPSRQRVKYLLVRGLCGARGHHSMSHSLLSCSTLSCEFPKRKETFVIQV